MRTHPAEDVVEVHQVGAVIEDGAVLVERGQARWIPLGPGQIETEKNSGLHEPRA